MHINRLCCDEGKEKVTIPKKHQTTIRINGREYNASTGIVMDVKGGRVPSVPLAQPRIPAPLTQPVSIAPKKSVMDISRTPALHHKHHAAQPGKTLMRSGVAKPAPGLKRTTKAQGRVALAKASGLLATKPSVHSVDHNRAGRAVTVKKSPAIKRFGGHVGSAPAAMQHAVTARQAVASEQARAVAGEIIHKADMFEQAIAHATSHEQPAHKPKTRRRSVASTYATAVLAFIVLGGFIAFQNATNIKLQVASSRAGFQAELPAQRPPGFSMASLRYQPGTVDVRYKSNSDDRSFAITQKASAWDSQALRETFLTSSSDRRDYDVVESGGRTIYVYGDSNATWVNGGIWYQVTSDGSLSERQLVDLATSM